MIVYDQYCGHNCEDHSLLDFTSAVQYMKYFIYNFTFIPHGLIWTHKWPASNVSGFIAQLVRVSYRNREVFRFNILQLESKDTDMTISERGTWNKTIELHIYVFFFHQTSDTLVTSTRSSNYRGTNWKATVVSRIFKKASSAFFSYHALSNAKVSGRFCLLPVR